MFLSIIIIEICCLSNHTEASSLALLRPKCISLKCDGCCRIKRCCRFNEPVDITLNIIL